MPRLSVKQQLIQRMQEKIDGPDLFEPRANVWAWRSMQRQLKERGSGPLPFWAKELAREWGLS